MTSRTTRTNDGRPARMFRVGQLIWLKKFEDQPAQRARVLDFKRGVVTVELLRQFRDGRWDDGLRELPEEQVDYDKTRPLSDGH